MSISSAALRDGLERGFHNLFRRSDKRNHSTIGSLSRIDVQQTDSVGRFDNLGDLPDDRRILSFTEIGNTFDKLLHMGCCQLSDIE